MVSEPTNNYLLVTCTASQHLNTNKGENKSYLTYMDEELVKSKKGIGKRFEEVFFHVIKFLVIFVLGLVLYKFFVRLAG
jgi:cytochrome c biogenesis protein ResB